MTNLTIARRCGWRYEWVEALDPRVYEVVIAELEREQAHAEQRSGRRVFRAGDWGR